MKEINSMDSMAENAANAARSYAITSADAAKRFQPLCKIMAVHYERYGWMFFVTKKKKSVLKRIAAWIYGLFGRKQEVRNDRTGM